MSEEKLISLVEDPSWVAALEMTTLCILPMALKAAVKLNVFEILAKQGQKSTLSAEEILKFIPASNPKAAALRLDRVLVLLSCHSLLSLSWGTDSNPKNKTRRYGLTPKSKYFVNDENGFSLGKYMLCVPAAKVFVDSFHYLDEVILEGGDGFVKAHGKKTFEFIQDHPLVGAEFQTAMSNVSNFFMEQLLQTYNGFENIGTLVDVGGGVGSCLNLIVQRHTHLTAVNYDQPHVIASAPVYPRVEHVGGNMFERVPSGDAIFMKWILHDWEDEECLKVLCNCRQALSDHGKVIVVDEVLPAAGDELLDGSERVAYQYDLLMLAVHGSKERTEEEFRQLAVASGFSGMRVVCMLNNKFGVMELYK